MNNSSTYTTAELCDKYNCAPSTIRKRIKTKDFPKGERFGRGVVYGKNQVHAWEKIHMPHLHEASNAPTLTANNKPLDRWRAQVKAQERIDKATERVRLKAEHAQAKIDARDHAEALERQIHERMQSLLARPTLVTPPMRVTRRKKQLALALRG